jgi:hypothetical protein
LFCRFERRLISPALRPCFSSALVWVLALHLVWGQALGLVHSAAHGASVAGVIAAHDPVAGDHAHPDGHEHTEVCRLLDQAAHTDALATAHAALNPPASSQAAFASPFWGSLRQHAFVYRARGPPILLV